MERFVFSAPADWRAGAPGEWAVAGATLTVSQVGPLPEHVPGFIAGALGAKAGPVERVALASGWPAHAAEATDGDQRTLVLVLQIVERAVTVRLAGPAESFAGARAAVVAALGAGTVDWGPPAFHTLAELLEGVHK